jgi:hypothetical protein
MFLSVLDHIQRLIGDGFHAPILGDVLAQQSVEVLVASPLQIAIRLDKVCLNAQPPTH